MENLIYINSVKLEDSLPCIRVNFSTNMVEEAGFEEWEDWRGFPQSRLMVEDVNRSERTPIKEFHLYPVFLMDLMAHGENVWKRFFEARGQNAPDMPKTCAQAQEVCVKYN